MKKIVTTVVMLSFLSISMAFADSVVEQKTKFRMGGALGGIVNMMGGSATREGIVSKTAIKGNRRLMRTGDSGELVDLNEEKVYRIDFKNNSYKVVTFAELRKQMEDMKAQAEKNNAEAKKSKEKMPEFDVTVDVRETGARETINGYNTRQSIVTVTATEKGKTLAQSGGVVLTADMWLGPKVPALREETDFQVRYIQKAYGSAFEGDIRQMAMVMASAPAFSKAMKKLQDKRGALEGSPIRSELRFETVAAPGQVSERESAGEDPSLAAMKAVGGLLGRMNRKKDAEAAKSAEKSDKPAKPGHSMLFTSNTEVLKAQSGATADEVALPAGARQKS